MLVKHVDCRPSQGSTPQRLETQLLHREGGSWRPYSYLWDEDGRDAALVDAAGGERMFQGSEDQERTWHVNATNECKLVPQRRGGDGARFCAQSTRFVDIN